MNLFDSLFKSRDRPENLGDHSFMWGGASSGKVVNERTAMQMTAVYSCVRINILFNLLLNYSPSILLVFLPKHDRL